MLASVRERLHEIVVLWHDWELQPARGLESVSHVWHGAVPQRCVPGIGESEHGIAEISNAHGRLRVYNGGRHVRHLPYVPRRRTTCAGGLGAGRSGIMGRIDIVWAGGRPRRRDLWQRAL